MTTALLTRPTIATPTTVDTATVTPATEATPAPAVTSDGDVDYRATYISFGLAYLFGHGSAALAGGDTPLVAMPGWMPMALLGIGMAIGTVNATRAALRAQRGASDNDVRSAKLLGMSWVVGFTALFLAITGLSASIGAPELQTMLWPAGSGLIVGLIYLSEGATRRNTLHYTFGAYLALVSTTALFFGTTGLFWILTIAGGGGYAIATLLEFRRQANRHTHH
ncbi:ABC transporter permease [Nocardia callitridis]|uniref:ABC transporter permease n=1 Tax=Nocardia callitridis TaxID=648753 RepID=A0ABP9L325_9NOCA